jgi:serine/threonine-protein kinase
VTLTHGTHLGSYQITGLLGVGGMGEVYRATDTSLKRQVAIKVLPAAVASDPARLARFQREAEILAALNHPNIAHIHGLEKADGAIALVMELVEGPTLGDRIGRGAIPLGEALAIARQIAEALDAAHEQGIIHRDLKPTNIKVRDDGIVKVLDFGLAKALEPSSAMSANTSISPTITSPAMTQAGIILGTAAYMAPEQAHGRPVDKRADIWAFGCVLYEMLTGRLAFGGDDVTDTIVSVVSKEPDWSLLPPSAPDSVRRLLRRCLIKSVQQRLRSIGDAVLEIDDATPPVTDASTDEAIVNLAKSPVARWLRATGAGVLLLAVAVAGWMVGRRQTAGLPASTSAMRFSLVRSAADAITVSGNSRDLAVAPDGRTIAYVGGNGTSLIIRHLDRSDTTRIDRVGLPQNPFFSSDGAWVGFVDGLSAIKKVSVRGGSIETVCRISYPVVQPAWHRDTIVFAQYGRIFRVSAAGGVAEPITPPLSVEGPRLYNPSFLPAGNAILVGVASPTRSGIGIVDLRTGALKLIVQIPAITDEFGLQARFVAPNRLIYRAAMEPGAEAPALRVVGFDVGRLETVDQSVAVEESVFVSPFGGFADFDVAENGTLVYVASSARPNARRLVWVTREGREELIDLPERAYTYPNFSPDGRQVAFDIRDQENDAWIWNLGGNTLRRLTFDRGFNQYVVWAHDQRHLVYTLSVASVAGAVNRIYWQSPDGRGQPEVLTERPALLAPYGFSKDDRHLIFREDSVDTGHDLMTLSLDAGHRVEPLLKTPFNELNAEVSPDGRWLAFESDASGTDEIYVRPFPDVNAGLWQVSTAGGRTPRWSQNGQELFFLGPDSAMMTALVDQTTTAFVSRAPTLLFEHRNYVGGASIVGRTYDVAPDGRRFLMIKPAASPDIAVVVNWTQTLNKTQ